jgi:hypothetical protein
MISFVFFAPDDDDDASFSGMIFFFPLYHELR